MRRLRLNSILVAGAVVLVAGAALVASQGSSGSTSAVAPSPTPAIDRFASAYVRFLDGGAGAALPGATSAVQRAAGAGGAFPASARSSALALLSTQMHYLSGTDTGWAALTARVGALTVPFEVAFHYSGGVWRIVSLLPPDISQLTTRGAARKPPAVPAAAQRLAHDFVLAYAAYREGLRPAPAGLAPMRTQLAHRSDPLGQITPTSQAPALVSLSYGPPDAGEIDVTATVLTGSDTHSFDVVLQEVGGSWQVLGFAESTG